MLLFNATRDRGQAISLRTILSNLGRQRRRLGKVHIYATAVPLLSNFWVQGEAIWVRGVGRGSRTTSLLPLVLGSQREGRGRPDRSTAPTSTMTGSKIRC